MNPNRARFAITAVFGVVIVVVVYALVHPLLASSPSSKSSSSSATSATPNPRPAVYVVDDSRFSAGLPSGWAVAKDFAGTVTAAGAVAKAWEFHGQSTTTVLIGIAETPSQAALTQAPDSSTFRSTQIPIEGETGILTVTSARAGSPLAALSVVHKGELFSVNFNTFNKSADPEKVAKDFVATWNWK
jgi:hypothetical protein